MAKRFALLVLIALPLAGCSTKEPARSGGRTADYWAQVLREEPKAGLRVKAATKLGPLVLIDKEALPAVQFALKDADVAVRLAAVRSLRTYVGPKAGEVLPALHDLQEHDPNRDVREAASKAIEKLQ